MGEYDDLMKAAKQKLAFEKNGTLGSEEETVETPDDIYAALREEAEADDNSNTSSKPELTGTIDYSTKPEFDYNGVNYDKDDDYFIDPSDSPVFEGGPGIAKVQLWKKQYGITKVYHTKILDRHFLFRTLNRAEYEQIASLALDSLTNEELICKTCVLWPYNYDYAAMGKDDAGYPGTLAQIIMENSGFTNDYGIEVL
jgi:hypothetical protein